MPGEHSALVAPRPGSPTTARRRPRLARRALLRCGSVVVATTAALSVMTTPASAAPSTYIGVAGDHAGLSRSTGEPLALHSYSRFDRRVPANADMITVKTSAKWSQVAAARPGSALYEQIAQYARGVKALNRTVMVAYHHEPEAGGSRGFGTSQEFVAAYRQVVSIFNSVGATNVEWTWQMTAYSFRVRESDRRAAINWYPGDAYVDNVSADGYNWGSCDGHSGKWLSFASFTEPVVQFARAHGKKASLGEFGSVAGSQRAQWLRDAHQYVVANRDVISAAFYFQNGSSGAGDTCNWLLQTSAEHDAFGDMARDTSTFRS